MLAKHYYMYYTIFLKLVKRLKTDLKNLKSFLNFRTVSFSGSSSWDNEFEIQNHCFIFRLPRDLNSGTYALGNSILSLAEFLSMFECKDTIFSNEGPAGASICYSAYILCISGWSEKLGFPMGGVC